jgi:hypothetical protein
LELRLPPAIDPEHVATALAEFGDLWDVLYPQGKTWIVHLLAERVVYGSDQAGIRLVFCTQQLQDLAPDPD